MQVSRYRLAATTRMVRKRASAEGVLEAFEASQGQTSHTVPFFPPHSFCKWTMSTWMKATPRNASSCSGAGRWGFIYCSQHFAILCFATVYYNTSAVVTWSTIAWSCDWSFGAVGICVFGACMSRSHDIHMPIYGNVWHGLTHACTLTWHFGGYKCYHILKSHI